jgi:hypothetical protein
MTDPPLEATINPVEQASDDALAEWRPVSGEATSDLLARQASLDDGARSAIRRQAMRILARCGEPTQNSARREAHLVVGEVQSGKTLSFTTLIALARDNDFPLVVVVAGTKRNLLQQTVDRFGADMLANDGRLPAFRRFVVGDYNQQDLTGALRAAVDTSAPREYRPTVVVFVMKNRSRVERLAEDLQTSIAEVGHVPALVIDDEADQAGMNVARPGRESTVYVALADLRRSIPRNDMLMYTATPQAPLLMSVADQWAPRTVAVLRSGVGYVGGERLFVDHATDYVRVISDDDLAIALDPAAEDPPQSLRDAILFFLLALAATQKNGSPRPLSMLIHPARTRDLHERHHAWTRGIVDAIRQALSDPEDVAFTELVDELRPLYDDMIRTSGEAPLTLEESARTVRFLIPNVEIKLVNSGTPEEIGPDDWGRQPGWIVIGGAKLDRGFTVENLAVTYMPRGTGVGAADSIQQRGRFFGYKGSYVGYLRGWFNADTAEAFRNYVTHERSVVQSLEDVERTALPLREWKRQFLLDESYSPTRRSAVRLPTTSWSVVARNGWFVQRQPYEPETADENIATFQQLRALAGPLTPDPRDPRTNHRHQTAIVATSDALPLLWGWRALGPDATRLNGLQLALAADPELKQLDEVFLVFIDGYDDVADHSQRRQRTVSDSGGAPLQQGRGSGQGGYPGDAAFSDADRMTIQLFLLSVRDQQGATLSDLVPAIAIHLANAPDFYLES